MDSDVTGTPTGGKINRHLELAYNHAVASWFPVNPAVVLEIRTAITSGKYNGKPKQLVHDLRKDYALYTHCVKKLIEARSASGMKAETPTDPVDLIRNAENEQLLSILASCSSSDHSLKNASPEQALRIQQSVMSATCCEALSQKCQIDGDLAFSCALFRQLGLTLIAWNYPHVYQRAIKSLRGEETIDIALTKKLGFSPRSLAITIARKWAFPEEFLAGMGDTEAAPVSADSRKIADTLAHICEVGETLARASDPEHYPTAVKDLEDATREVEALLGKSGMTLIQNKLRENLEVYAAALPELFPTAPEIAGPEENAKRVQAHPRLRDNHYARYCVPLVQEYLRTLYGELKDDTVSRSGVELLVKEIIPAAGFERGCVYLIEPDSQLLVPRLVIGPPGSRKYAAVSSSVTMLNQTPIAAAYRRNMPIMEQESLSDGISVSWIAGALGELQKTGVLYLEISEKLLTSDSSNPMACFKALRQALVDCLGIK